jgi:hypothetical protein
MLACRVNEKGCAAAHIEPLRKRIEALPPPAIIRGRKVKDDMFWKFEHLGGIASHEYQAVVISFQSGHKQLSEP